MRVHVTSGIDDLATDLASIAKRVRPEMRVVVRDGIKVGADLAKGFAREKSGPHGKAYYKRIDSEMHGGLGLFGNTISGEFGPRGFPKSEFVGAGFRHGVNTDLPRAADIIGPAFLRSVDDAVKGWFW